MAEERRAKVTRNTKETDITIDFSIDGKGEFEANSGIGFFDHMLEAFVRHGLFDMKADIKGDLQVDCHHTIEDTGIVLGNAIKKALGSKLGIKRYGSCILPMDEVLVLSSVDLCGRPYLSFEAEFPTEKIGYMDTEMVREFFYALSYSMAANIHIKIITPGNSHHMCEAIFKAFAKALDEATIIDERITGSMTTKGTI